ncbi:MAG: 2,3-bisphosphoglycerate-independent phosphoglycerate mutase [Actinobacteria bacterium]|nr:MAG: 2,3-bisphosphoglycerate-independent phosphoglycerate mutase [Actinomycetota bacterium]
MSPRQLLYVCLDGLGDDPVPELDGRTPLEAARTPVLDDLVRHGAQGLVYTVGPDVAPESDIAVFAILGYDPREEHPGRGVLEALGSGMDFRDGELAYRVNFATQEDGRIVDRRVGRDLPSRDARALAAEVNERLRLPAARFDLRATVEHRGALVIRSNEGPLSAEVSNTDPAYARQGTLGVALETFEDRVAEATPLDDSDGARRAADLTNRFVQDGAAVLEASAVNARRRGEGRLPANLILTRDGGDHVPKLQPIRERFGPAWGCFVEMPVERGIAILLGMAPVDAPTGMPRREQYAAWAQLAAEALGGYDALYVHIKGPDVPAHDGRAEDKRQVIEDIDAAFFGEVLPRIRSDRTLLAVTADHSTSCVRKAHTADPVPLLVAGPGVAADGTVTFGERAAREGGLGTLAGVEILPRLVDLLRS